MNKILVIDFMGLVYSSHYAHSRLSYNGNPTGAVFGFASQLMNYIKIENPSHLVIALEGGNLKRKEISKEYKANRKSRPDEIKQQQDICERIGVALGGVSMRVPGYEADDVIASVCTQFANDETICHIYSGDKDLMQLVNKNVFQFTPRDGSTYDRLAVEAKFGVKPDQISELLALQGDASDNIPGARGIGPKAASAMLNSYGTIENLYKNIHLLKPNFQDKLAKSVDAVKMSQELTKLHCDLDVGMLKEPGLVSDKEVLAEIFAESGMSTLIDKLGEM